MRTDETGPIIANRTLVSSPADTVALTPNQGRVNSAGLAAML
jgi:hypothetical protein